MKTLTLGKNKGEKGRGFGASVLFKKGEERRGEKIKSLTAPEYENFRETNPASLWVPVRVGRLLIGSSSVHNGNRPIKL